jgi:chorismate mutase
MKTSRLEELRQQIDRLDERLVEMLAHRFRLTDEIGRLKKELGLPPIDEAREQAQRIAVQRVAKRHGLREETAMKVMRVVIDEVVTNHGTI